MSVYTKTGDKGTTGLYTGQRVKKNSLRVKAYGTVDEVCSALAMARAACAKQAVKDTALLLQKYCSWLMADLASLGAKPMIGMDKVTEVEHIIDGYEAQLPPLRAFVIPGNTLAGSYLDLARTITRRAERNVLDLLDAEGETAVHDSNRIFLNRLSDLCFVLMRFEEM